MDPGQSVGVRRHHRARSLESLGCAARHTDLRHLEPVAHRRGTRPGARRNRGRRQLLRHEPAGAGVIALRVLWGGLALSAATAVADTSASAPQGLLQACAAIGADAERLACYDRLAGHAVATAKAPGAASAPAPAAGAAAAPAAG